MRIGLTRRGFSRFPYTSSSVSSLAAAERRQKWICCFHTALGTLSDSPRKPRQTRAGTRAPCAASPSAAGAACASPLGNDGHRGCGPSRGVAGPLPRPTADGRGGAAQSLGQAPTWHRAHAETGNTRGCGSIGVTTDSASEFQRRAGNWPEESDREAVLERRWGSCCPQHTGPRWADGGGEEVGRGSLGPPQSSRLVLW